MGKQRQYAIPLAAQATILFLVGLALLIREATLPAVEVSWPRLVVYAGMMGGPFAAHADRVRQAGQALNQRTRQDDDREATP